MAGSRLARAAGLAVAASALLPAAAPALDGLRIAPSRIDATVERGDVLPAVTVTNASPARVRLQAHARRAGSALDGLPTIDEAPGAARRGRGFLAVSPARFTLAPGESREVRARVTGGPVRERGAYGVVLVTGRAAGSQRVGNAGVAPVLRLAGNVLLTYAGPGGSAVDASGLRVVPGPGGALRFLTRAHNGGRIHSVPETRLVVRDADGHVRARLGVGDPGAVLPRSDRDLVADVTDVLPAGAYVAESTVLDGERRSRARTSFRLSGPNELATADVEVTGLTVSGSGERFATEVALRNRGAAAGSVPLVAALTTQRGVPVAEQRLKSPRLGAREGATVRLDWEGLERGAYRLEVHGPDGAGRSVQFEASGRSTPFLARVLDWLAAHLQLAFLGFAVAALLIGTAVFLHVRNLQRRLRTVSGP